MKNITILLLMLLPFFGVNATIYEAENATINGTALIVDDATSSGAKYVDTQTGGVMFSVNIQTAGWYSLTIALRSDNASRQEDFQIDTQPKFTILASNTASTFAEIPICGNQYFTAGVHSITSTKNWGYVSIDYIKIEPTNIQIYQGEQVTPLRLQNAIYTASGTSEGKYLAMKDGDVTFNLTIPTTGNYKITVIARGLGDAGRTNDFGFDSNTPIGVEMVSTIWSQYTISNSQYFTAGNHTLNITKVWGYIDIDYLVVEYTGSGTNLDKENDTNITISSSNKAIIINADDLYNFEIYNISGMLITSKDQIIGNSVISVNQMGIYIVVVSCKSNKVVRKVSIKG